uniref:Uncharacterized protein n=1 Tax=Steinernema glaseri TaxID=37863 RepID=A0A1I7ZK25_9BILA
MSNDTDLSPSSIIGRALSRPQGRWRPHCFDTNSGERGDNEQSPKGSAAACCVLRTVATHHLACSVVGVAPSLPTAAKWPRGGSPKRI